MGNVGSAIDGFIDEVPFVNVAYDTVKATGAAAAGVAVAATGGDSHKYFAYGGKTMGHAVTRPAGVLTEPLNNVVEGVDHMSDNIPGLNIVHGAAKSAAATVAAAALAATGNDGSKFIDYAANTMSHAVTHPLGNPLEAIRGADHAATALPVVGTIWDAHKALGAASAAGVVAAIGHNPKHMLDTARDAGIDAGINLAADVLSVGSGFALTGVARVAGAAAKTTTKALTRSAARALESHGTSTLAIEVAEMGQSAAEHGAAATAKAEMRAAALGTGVLEAETEAATETALKVAAKQALTEEATLKTAAKETGFKNRVWQYAKPTKLDVAVGLGFPLDEVLPYEEGDATGNADPRGSEQIVAGTEDVKEPQVNEGVDLIALMESANLRVPRAGVKQRIQRLDYERALVAELPDYTWMMLPLAVGAAYLLVSEA